MSAATIVGAARTPVSREELRGAIGRAYNEVTGHAASRNVLDTLTAQASLETGSGSQMYNYNFGGIKGASPEGVTARCRTKEVIDGREVEVRDGFRAYSSLDRGAVDYVRVLTDKFHNAVAQAETGNIDGFAHALKQAHYYTADEAKYASALHALTGTAPSPTPVAVSSKPMNVGPPVELDTAGLGRILDAVSTHHRTVEEDSDED